MIDLKVKSIIANGDCALLIRFVASKNRLVGIHALCADLLERPLENLINVIPASNNLTLVFSTKALDSQVLHDDITKRCMNLKRWQNTSKTHEIPVCYHADVAADLTAVCDHLSVSVEQLIQWHTQPKYVVAMLGFLPGFAYLNGNHEALKVPRKATPAVQVPAGSVAVAGKQTGLYALASPGGWQVIGRTKMSMLDWQNKQQPMRFNPLDRVQFKAISLTELQAGGESR